MYQAQLTIVCLTTQYGDGISTESIQWGWALQPPLSLCLIRDEWLSWLTRLAKWRRENLHAGQSQVKSGMRFKCHIARHFSFMSKSTSAVCATTYSVSRVRVIPSFLFLSLFLSISISSSLLCSAQPRLVHAPVLRDTQCSGLLDRGAYTHTLTLFGHASWNASRRRDALSRHVWHMLIRAALARSVNSVLISFLISSVLT